MYLTSFIKSTEFNNKTKERTYIKYNSEVCKRTTKDIKYSYKHKAFV